MRRLSSLFCSVFVAAALAGQDVPDRLLVGYWHNWPNSPNTVPLAAVPDAYDVVNVSFAVPTVGNGATMQFTPFVPLYPSTQSFAADVAALQAAGKKVLISIGGANHPVGVDSPADAQAFATSMLQILVEQLHGRLHNTPRGSPTTPFISRIMTLA